MSIKNYNKGFTPLHSSNHYFGERRSLAGKNNVLGVESNSFRRSVTGFTLVELLVVIAIIGVLSSVVLVSLNSARVKARDAKRVADLASLRVAMEGYYDGNYGSDGTGADTGYEYPTALSSLAQVGVISAEPKDPSAGAAYGYNSAGCTIANQSYIIRAVLETAHPGLDNDVDTNPICTLDCSDGKNYCVGP